jgi:hypothetical protein
MLELVGFRLKMSSPEPTPTVHAFQIFYLSFFPTFKTKEVNYRAVSQHKHPQTIKFSCLGELILDIRSFIASIKKEIPFSSRPGALARLECFFTSTYVFASALNTRLGSILESFRYVRSDVSTC